jgi:sialidase-1
MKAPTLILLTSLLPIGAASYESTTQTLPILNDGEPTVVLRFNFQTKWTRTLTDIKIDIQGTTDISDIQELSVMMDRKSGDLLMGKIAPQKGITILKQSTKIPAGNHTCKLVIRIKKNANLLHRIGLQIKEFTFEDGKNLTVAADRDYSPARLAYPIHKRGQHKCHTFRIPAIARANNGNLLAVYDMRYNSRRDLQEHMDIGLSMSKDGGQSWSAPRPIMDMGTYGGKSQKENGCSDPGIIVDATTCEIFVTACWTHDKPNTHQWSGNGSEPGLGIHKSTQFMAVKSVDHGESWSAPENWTKALKDPSWYLFAPAPGNGITMSDGTLVMPTQGRDAKGRPFSNITWSKDHGKTWHVSSHARDNTTENAVAELSDGSLMLNMRDNRNHRDKSRTNGRAVATTKDLGKTWRKHSSDHGALPEPTCMASLISLKHSKGKHVLFFSNPRNKNGRSKMTIQMSLDDGKTWLEKHHILLDTKGGAYSSLVEVDDQTIGILYESSAADMIFQKIPLKDFHSFK